MSDKKEVVTQKIVNILLKQGIEPKTINKIKNSIILELNNYDIVNKSTAIVPVDFNSEHLIKLYVSTLKTEGKSINTIYEYERLLVKFLYAVNKPLTDVDVFDIRVYLANMQQQVTNRTCENYRSYLSAFYQWLTNEDIIQKNPMVKIKPIKFVEELKTAFSDVELDALRTACKTTRERAELELLLSCGARVSELCAMNIDDINFNTHAVTIREGKGGKQRVTYASDVCLVHLRTYINSRKDNSNCLFISKLGTRISKGSVEEDLHRIGDRAGVANTHPHRCRRTFATGLARRGMNIQTIQMLMGHSSIETTRSYIAVSLSQVENEYRRFS